MIEAIAELGRASGIKDVVALTDRVEAEHVIEIKIKIDGSDARYVGISLQEKGKDEWYLYRRDFSGKPGIFWSGNIGVSDIKKMKQNFADKKIVKSFLKRKVEWIPECKLIGNKGFLKSIDVSTRNRIDLIRVAINRDMDKIEYDILKEIKSIDPENLLITIKIADNLGEHFIGELKEFTDLFKMYILGDRENANGTQNVAKPLCAVCNKPATLSTFREKLLLFFTLDKPNFLPDGIYLNDYKVFPICSGCYLDLQKGQRYIKDNLDFQVLTPKGGTKLRFWLIPVLGSTILVKDFLDDLNRGGLSLRNLSQICQSVDVFTQSHLDSQPSRYEAFLSFASLFYFLDNNGHMRLITMSEGIYPRRLKAIVAAKSNVDSNPTFYKNKVRFGFPLIVELFEGEKEETSRKMLTLLLTSIFTDKQMEPSLIFGVTMNKIRGMIVKNPILKEMASTSLKGLALTEYLFDLNVIALGGDKIMEGKSSEWTKDSRVVEIEHFLERHRTLLHDGTLRATFAVGVAVGILLETQKNVLTTGKSPFWNHLNRLEMDFDRIESLLPKVINKMHQYDEHEYDSVLSYLGTEAANLNPLAKDIPNELLNFVFSIGMSEGYIITQFGKER
jgi:CRISPR-associated Csh1 family protein